MSSSAIITSLLVFGDPQPLVAEVIGAEATATTYVLNCVPGDDNDCGTFNETVTLGPWASKTLPSGAKETGNYDIYVNIPYETDPWTFSIHCEMSRSVAQVCTTTNIGGNDDGRPTGTLSGSDLEDVGLATFEYMPVTITAGQHYLSAADSVSGKTSATSAASSNARTTGASQTAAKTTGSESAAAQSSSSAVDSAASPEKTNGAISCAARVLTAMSVAGIAMGIVMA